jgi:hypothetical protein
VGSPDPKEVRAVDVIIITRLRYTILNCSLDMLIEVVIAQADFNDIHHLDMTPPSITYFSINLLIFSYIRLDSLLRCLNLGDNNFIIGIISQLYADTLTNDRTFLQVDLDILLKVFFLIKSHLPGFDRVPFYILTA